MALSRHEALIYCMVAVSAADGDMTEPEIIVIRGIVDFLPIFNGFDVDNLAQVSNVCAKALVNHGFEAVLEDICEALPAHLRETAYALAVEVAAADLTAKQSELNFLQMLRYRLDIDRLVAAGIERGARARYAR